MDPIARNTLSLRRDKDAVFARAVAAGAPVAMLPRGVT